MYHTPIVYRRGPNGIPHDPTTFTSNSVFMINKRFILLLFGLFLGLMPVAAQETAVYTDADRHFKRGLVFFEKGLLAKAKREFKKTIDRLEPVHDMEGKLLKSKAELLRAQCAIRLEQPEGELLTLDYIRTRRPDPEYDQALIDIADYYFDQRKYDKALSYLNQVPTLGMSLDQRSEVRFKQGYAHFVKQDFRVARSYLEEIHRDRESNYYAQANYYLGLCYFFEGDYEKASEVLSKVQNDPTYSRHIPYYLAQFYFANQQYEKLITEIEPRINDTRLRNRKELHQLLGQAYFEQGKYQQALPYLEYYSANSRKLREEELYQLGYAQYQTGDYRKAVQSLKPLTTADSPIGQNAMFYLADCYLKLGDKSNALTALASAKRMDYDEDIQEDALFNHGKLAYELGFPREAIADLQAIKPNSPYFPEAQNLMSDIFLSYRDYQQALSILEDMRKRTNNPRILETYQKVSVNRGLQLLQEGDEQNAKQLFEQSLETPIDPKTRAVAYYWLGDIKHHEENYEGSIQHLDRYFSITRAIDQMPEEASPFTANYLQGYNYLKLKNYNRARTYFRETVEGINRNRRFLANRTVTNDILGDATMRLGDAYFKDNQYEQAITYYNQAIDNRYAGYDYAIYQKAIIEGLRGRKTEEIIALQNLADNFPNSEYADDALLQLGSSYQDIGQLSKAEAPLRRLISDFRRKSPLINQALLKLGLISYNQGNIQQAISYYKQVFGNNPESNEASLALAALEEIYVRDLGRPNEYFAFLETVPGYKPDNLLRDSITFQSAETMYENGDYSGAISAYTNYLRQYPRGRYTLPAHYHRGESHGVLREYSEALEDYAWVVDQGPSRYYLKALEKAAIIAYNFELDFERAFDLYSKLESAADSEEALFEAQLGALRSAYRAGNTDAVYQRAQQIARNSRATDQQIATANFYLGKLSYDNGNLQAALPALEKVVALSDNEQTAEARYLIADIYYRQRNLEQAQTLLLEANQESSAYPYWVAKSVILLSDVMRERGDLYNARAALEALLENYDQDPKLVDEARRKLGQINRQIDQSSKLDSGSDDGVLDLQNNGGNSGSNNRRP